MFDGLYHPFMVIRGMVSYGYTNIRPKARKHEKKAEYDAMVMFGGRVLATNTGLTVLTQIQVIHHVPTKYP